MTCQNCKRLIEQLRQLTDSFVMDDDDSCASEPPGEEPVKQTGDSGSTPTEATTTTMEPEPATCIWCLSNPCMCDRLDFGRAEPAPGTDVG